MADPIPTLTKTERNLWNAIVAEAVAHLKYSAFAHQALREGHPEVAQVFQEVAGAETIHGINHMSVAGELKSSLENLKSVVEGEAKEISTMYPNYIRDARDEGRNDAADTFMMAMDREQHHLEVFNRAVEVLEAKLAVAGPVEAVASPPRPDPQRTAPPVTEPQTASIYDVARTEVETRRWDVASKGRIREVVFGGQDGLLSTMLLVTALAVGDIGNTAVLIGGLAGALAGMVSMATGAFLGSRAEQDLQRSEIEKEAQELQEHPAEELAELVVLYQREGLSFKEAQGVADHIAADKDLWLRTMIEKELGLSAEITTNPVKDALVMGVAFIAGAIIPVLPYFFDDGGIAITSSVSATLVALFGLGMLKGRIVRKSTLLQGLEILAIGGVAVGVGWVLGEVIPRLVT